MTEPSSPRFSWAWVRQWLEVLPWRPRVIAALVTAGVLLTFALSQWFSLTQEPASFSLAAEYYQEAAKGRVDIAYTTDDPHELEATLNHSGSLDFRTRVAAFRPAGYQLQGGKVEHAATYPVAVAVYKGSDGQIVCLRQKGTMPPPPHGAKLLNDHMYVYVRAGLTAVYSQSQDHFCILMSAMSPDTFLHTLSATVPETKDYGTKPPPHGIRSMGHCERSEAIFARKQRLLRRGACPERSAAESKGSSQ
jgi:hypothetical protein